MSESESVRRRYAESSSGAHIRWSRSEPSVSNSDKTSLHIRKPEEISLSHYAAPFSVWFLQVCTHAIQTVMKVGASLLALLLITCLLALILPYMGLPAIPDQLPRATNEFSKHILRVIHNYSVGNVKKRYRLRVYQF